MADPATKAKAIAQPSPHKAQKRDRSAFGYMEPEKKMARFAQCSTCRLWLKQQRRCYWLGPDKEVRGNDSCIMYTPGYPIYGFGLPGDVFEPEVVGFYRGDVRCENCVSGDKRRGRCMLFETLNASQPQAFDLDEAIEPQGCCNAFHPR